MTSIAYFITPHGYGHAARAAGIMAALQSNDATVRFEIFTSVPKIFFETSLNAPVGYHALMTDVGLVQDTPTQEDIPATLHALEKMYPFDERMLSALAETTRQLRCELVICDIAPLGIAVAKRAGISSLLVENFRWDWIYENYQQFDSRFTYYSDHLRSIFESADHLIQTEPLCVRHNAHLVLPPICRLPRTPKADVRAALGIQPGEKAIYVSMGGSQWDISFLNDLQKSEHIFLVSGGNLPPQRQGNVIILDFNSYMPDLLAACDAVISKAGYSTLAEVYYAGMPIGYISRQHFQESPVLEEFIGSHMQGIKIEEADFYSGAFLRHVDELLALPHIQRDASTNGANTAAAFIAELLRNHSSS